MIPNGRFFVEKTDDTHSGGRFLPYENLKFTLLLKTSKKCILIK
jgi:hypothetical protein